METCLHGCGCEVLADEREKRCVKCGHLDNLNDKNLCDHCQWGEAFKLCPKCQEDKYWLRANEICWCCENGWCNKICKKCGKLSFVPSSDVRCFECEDEKKKFCIRCGKKPIIIQCTIRKCVQNVIMMMPKLRCARLATLGNYVASIY